MNLLQKKNRAAKLTIGGEMEDTLKRIQESKNVVGTMLINREGIPIRTSLDTSVTAQYSGILSHLAERAIYAVKAMDPTNELQYLRMTTKKQEILVAPDDDFKLIVIQKPCAGPNDP